MPTQLKVNYIMVNDYYVVYVFYLPRQSECVSFWIFVPINPSAASYFKI